MPAPYGEDSLSRQRLALFLHRLQLGLLRTLWFLAIWNDDEEVLTFLQKEYDQRLDQEKGLNSFYKRLLYPERGGDRSDKKEALRWYLNDVLFGLEEQELYFYLPLPSSTELSEALLAAGLSFYGKRTVVFVSYGALVFAAYGGMDEKLIAFFEKKINNPYYLLCCALLGENPKYIIRYLARCREVQEESTLSWAYTLNLKWKTPDKPETRDEVVMRAAILTLNTNSEAFVRMILDVLPDVDYKALASIWGRGRLVELLTEGKWE